MKRFTSSDLGCPRQMALSYMGKEKTINRFMKRIFEIGREHDEIMKEEAEAEWNDYIAPKMSLFKISDGKTIAFVKATPDGLRSNEVVEFKGLSPTNFNAIRSEEDLIGKGVTGLFKKYGLQVEMYAGFHKKEWIRFRIKNKKNLKVKDIRYRADPGRFKEAKKMILSTKKVLDAGKIPPRNCVPKQRKFCLYRDSCQKTISDEFENMKKKEIDDKTKGLLRQLSTSHLKLTVKINRLKDDKALITEEIKDIMRLYGQKEWENLKFGVRYKMKNNKEDIEKLIEIGRIGQKEVPEEYLIVSKEG